MRIKSTGVFSFYLATIAVAFPGGRATEWEGDGTPLSEGERLQLNKWNNDPSSGVTFSGDDAPAAPPAPTMPPSAPDAPAAPPAPPGKASGRKPPAAPPAPPAPPPAPPAPDVPPVPPV